MDTAKIVIVSPETLPVPPSEGGAVQTVIYEQLRRLKQHAVAVISPGNTKEDEVKESGHITYIRRADGSFSQDKQRRREQYIELVKQKLAALKPDIVHIHNRPQFVQPCKEVLPKAKVILHLHNEHLSNLAKKERKKVIDQCTKLVCVSQYIADQIKRKNQSAKSKLVVLPNGADTEKFHPVTDQQRSDLRKKLDYGGEDLVLLYVGRVVKEKGLDVLLKAVKRMGRRERKNIKVLIVGSSDFAGEDPSGYEKSVRSLAKKLKTNVRFTGYVDHRQLPTYYQMADVFVFPVRWNEPFGLVVCEAQACGVPVLSAKKGGIPEIVIHKKTGYLMPSSFGSKDLYRALRKIATNEKKLEKWGRKGRKRVERYFTWQRSAGELEKLYDQLAKNN